MKKTVFYGDSITEGFTLLNRRSEVKNMGISGDKTIDLIARVTDVIKEAPDRIVIMIGTNDYLVKKRLWQDFVDIDFKTLYSALLTLLRDNLPSSDIVLLSILPVALPLIDLTVYNQEIDEYNMIIKELAFDFNYRYRDLSSYFKTEDNNMNKKYTKDGVHLTSEGYQLLYKSVEDLIL